MKVSGVQTITAQQSSHETAAMMARIDCGALMVNAQERLIGMITDRDIAVRAVAEGRTADTLAGEVMSRDEQPVGVVSLVNIASSHGPDASSTVLQGVAKGH
jgi:CBS domain-containing protein